MCLMFAANLYWHNWVQDKRFNYPAVGRGLIVLVWCHLYQVYTLAGLINNMLVREYFIFTCMSTKKDVSEVSVKFLTTKRQMTKF